MFTCQICLHPERPQIDLELADRPLHLIAADHHLSLAALASHANHHTAKPAPEFAEIPAQYHVQRLLSKALPASANPVETLYARAQSQYLPAMTRLLALAAKLPPTPESKGFKEKDWWETRAKLLAALEPYPDAKQAVSRALAESPKMF